MDDNKNDINYYYVNRSLELTKGIPAIVLIAWLPSLLIMNIAAVCFSIVGSATIIYLYKQGFSVIEFISIIKFILRDKKSKLYDYEEKYENKDI